MRVATFYVSNQYAAGRQTLALPGGGHVYVRVTTEEVEPKVEGVDVVNPTEVALDKAEPLADESVMNTHEVPAV